MASSSPPGRRDRLSDLPDDLLGHVLTFLPNKPAGRTAVLSSRWRRIFSSVHTVSFEERPGERAGDWTTFYYEAHERKSCSAVLLDDVWSALLCRRRCAGDHVPLRRFRFAFDSCHGWNKNHVDQWITYVLRHCVRTPELHLDLCFGLGSICNNDDYRRGWYSLPRGLFSCTGIISLCLSYCQLNLPKAIHLPSVETLRLTGVSGDGTQRLIASCPRLTDLTLEANNSLEKVSVLDRRLRRFALRCCHSVKTVDIDASELRSLDYSGTVPPESLLSLHGSPEIIPSCTVDFCNVISADAQEHGKIKRFLEKISNAKRLHLHHGRIPYSYFQGFPRFSNLTRLALQGPIQSPDVVRGILEQTPNLEILSLFMENSVVLDGELTAPDEASFSVPCLRRRVREINMVHYQGDELQRTMARLLFRNALVLERMCVLLPRGPIELQARMKDEIETWVVAEDVEKIFL
uniref:Uncharacterized protein n=1 Tax=Avena sativa TaxID=4498 RepID=A0ACD5UWT2_AVESA